MKEGLRDELLRRMACDQEARLEAMELMKGLTPGAQLSSEAREAIQRGGVIDDENTAWLREVVRSGGWPKRSEVGEEAASAAWLLAQHADREPEFQRECLDLLQEAVDAGEASASSLAYLTDRVLCAEGRPQRYGTQFTQGPNGFEPQALEDPDRVDALRASVGLAPLAEYAQQIRELHS